jgi:hypothetical protein
MQVTTSSVKRTPNSVTDGATAEIGAINRGK